MNISITFRHMEPSDAIKSYAEDKVAKLQKFLRRPMTAKVTLALQKLHHVAETRVSSGGERLEATEASEDIYASIDRVVAKLERQIRGTKGAQQARKRGSETVRTGRLPKALEGVTAASASALAKAPKKAKRAAPARTAASTSASTKTMARAVAKKKVRARRAAPR
ncbi:MAG: ribosome-associated translation inhibitor RaiA [Polyangiaceae bacterium]|nr:ribosome-associated translation inhibitor RaiA [Polyangiaceae bacterium]